VWLLPGTTVTSIPPGVKKLPPPLEIHIATSIDAFALMEALASSEAKFLGMVSLHSNSPTGHPVKGLLTTKQQAGAKKLCYYIH
jgi:hypothetical protein